MTYAFTELESDRLPWEFRDASYPFEVDGEVFCETEVAFEAFRHYRDIPINFPTINRSLRVAWIISQGHNPVAHGGNSRALTQYKQAPTHFNEWARRFEWAARAQAMDHFLDRARLHARVDALRQTEELLCAHLPEVTATLVSMALGIQGRARVEGQHGFLPALQEGGKVQLDAIKTVLDKAVPNPAQRLAIDQTLTAQTTAHVTQHVEYSDDQLAEITSVLAEIGVIRSGDDAPPTEE